MVLAASGEERTIDFGLPFGTVGPGDCDAVLAKGLFLLCEPVDAILKRPAVVVTVAYQIQTMKSKPSNTSKVNRA